ncbi:hypothetical protein BH09PLA1_BH09PLA1_26820 [soil metagenome]
MQASETITISHSPVEPLGDGASSPPPRQLTVPRQLGPVKMQRELGRGGMGVVWLDRHELLHRDVAVKFMLTALEADDPGFAMFLAGARAASAVRHLGLTGILHADVIDAVPYLVMEYVDGFSAADLLDRFGLLSAEASIAIMRQVCDSVAELHDRAIVHRDIKPSNILIDGDGRAYVTDFGLTCVRPQAEAHVAGTPAYMAPEMLLGQVSPRSDVYALGVSMCELLTGSRTLSQLTDSRIDPMLIDLIERATKLDPIYRFKTARHLQRALAKSVPKASDDARIVARLIAQMRCADPDAPEAIVPQSGGNYFETIATLAKKKESERAQVSMTASAQPSPPPPIPPALLPPPLPQSTISAPPIAPASDNQQSTPIAPKPKPASSWIRRLFGAR